MSTTILIVDDMEGARASLRRSLEASDMDLRVIEAADGAAALPLALSADVQVDIILSDIVMPRLDGLQFIRAVRLQRDASEMPVILMTSQEGADSRELAFEAGANDYIQKPVTAAELLRRVSVQLRLRNLAGELRRTSDELQQLRQRDLLTGLGSRSHFMEASERELARCRRHGLCMTLAAIDVDKLRSINARLGEVAGDTAIVEVAALIERNMRADDLVARMSGGRFLVLLPQTDAAQAQALVDRLRGLLEGRDIAGLERRATLMSAGLATYPDAGHLETIEAVLNAAEAALDEAKRLGGNRVLPWAEARRVG